MAFRLVTKKLNFSVLGVDELPAVPLPLPPLPPVPLPEPPALLPPLALPVPALEEALPAVPLLVPLPALLLVPAVLVLLEPLTPLLPLPALFELIGSSELPQADSAEAIATTNGITITNLRMGHTSPVGSRPGCFTSG
jgi:hypothetical protein